MTHDSRRAHPVQLALASLSDAELHARLSDLQLSDDAAASLATQACEQGRDHVALSAALALDEQGGEERMERSELIAAACERSAETLAGQRLCACLLLVDWSQGVDFTRLPQPLADRLRSQGFCPDPRLLSVSDALSLSPGDTREIHARALGSPGSLWPAQPRPAHGGVQIRVLIASLPGARRAAWDDLDSERQSLALASLMDEAARGFPQGSVAALAAAPLGAALRQADAVGCPVALRVMVESACARAFCKPADLAAACSLHDQGDAARAPFWRLSIRVKDTGFMLCAMDWPLSGMSAENAFYEGVILELASLGVDECYHIEGAYDALLCPVCREPLYPAPDIPAWREAAQEAGLNPSGAHEH